ncbi:putative acetyltransferase [compost metagenome]
MQIREIASSELAELLALYRHLHAGDDPTPAMDVVETVWQELVSSSGNKYFGAYAEGRLVSSCTLAVIPNLTRGCRPYGLIENVVTDANYRKRGFASAVLAEALAFAWSRNCYKVMLMTGRKDEATFKFYESAGFNRHDKQAFIAKPPSA